MKAVTADLPEKRISAFVSDWWQQLTYRNKAAEWSLYFLFVSGILLWNQVSIPWSLERWLLVIHLLGSLLLFPLVVAPFWLAHRRLLQRSKKKLLKVTGLLLDYLLLGCLLSGVWLVLMGNRGDALGWVAYMTHLVTALVIVPLLIRHAAKWSVLQPLWSVFIKPKQT